jgi:alkylated DNA repair dioxygenase AlkB
VTLPEGFEHAPGWLNSRPGWSEARGMAFAELTRDLHWEQRSMRIYGRVVQTPRLVAFMGDQGYAYSGLVHERQRWHPFALAIRDVVAERCGVEFNTCLANLYRDGQDSVSWHSDSEPELGPEPTIASVSLGATRRFSIKRFAVVHDEHCAPWDLDLADGDLLVMSGRAQIDYRHCLPKTARPVGPRINLTFRLVHAGV